MLRRTLVSGSVSKFLLGSWSRASCTVRRRNNRLRSVLDPRIYHLHGFVTRKRKLLPRIMSVMSLLGVPPEADNKNAFPFRELPQAITVSFEDYRRKCQLLPDISVMAIVQFIFWCQENNRLKTKVSLNYFFRRDGREVSALWTSSSRRGLSQRWPSSGTCVDPISAAG